MCEFDELFKAGARVFEHFKNMPAGAPAISDPHACHADNAGALAARGPILEIIHFHNHCDGLWKKPIKKSYGTAAP